MGNLQAREMIDYTTLDRALDWHLSANHYPPVPSSMVPVCVAAIELASEGRWHDEVGLPEPITYRGAVDAPVWAIVEAHHLEPFIDDEGE